MTKPAACGYARLSEKTTQSSSIASQKKRIAEYCERYNIDLLEIFVDDGKSGWTFDRPGFIKLEAFCKKNTRVKYLIIVHFDRFSRADAIDAMTKERYFRDKLNVKVLQISEPPDTNTESNTYQVIRFMQAFAANEERNRIVSRVKTGMRYKMLQGQYCATAPFGYLNVTDGNGKKAIVIDEPKAKIIRRIYELYLNGVSIEGIRKIVLPFGFTIQGNSAIQRVLSNSVYASLLNVPAYENQPAKLIKANHEPIISEETYWKVQQLLNPKKFIPQKREEVPLRGVVHCRACGKLMTAAPSKSKTGKYYWYYFCVHDRKENYSAIKVHGWLDQILDAISIKGDYFNRLKEKLTATISEMINTQTRELMRVNLNIRTAEHSIEQIEGRYLLGNVSAESYNKVIKEKKAALSELITKRDFLALGTSDYLSRLDVMLKKAASVRTLYNNMNLVSKQVFIQQVFGKGILLTPAGFRTPFLHPVFQINSNDINTLPLIIEKETPSKEGKTDAVILTGTQVNPWEYLESILSIFAA